MSYVPEQPPPGWYPDPADHARERWWSGQGWTDHVQDAAPAVPTYATLQQWQPPETAAAEQAYVPMGSSRGLYDGSYGDTTSQWQSRAGSPNTPGIWLLALSPVIFTVAIVLAIVVSVATSVPTGWLSIGLIIGGLLLLIMLIFWDSSTLRRRNLPTPSAAWLLLGLVGIVVGLLAYMIARSVALASAGHKSLAPTLVFGFSLIALVALAVVLPFLLR